MEAVSQRTKVCVVRCGIATVIGLLALLGANAAFAQEGFQFTAPADAAIGRDYGFLAHGQKLTDTILIMRPPELSFINNSPRTDFTASYQPEIELFDNNRDLNALNHTGNASFAFRITDRLTFNASDDALISQDPTRSIAGSLIFLPRREFKQNMAHASFNYLLTRRTTLSFSGDSVASSGRTRNAGTVSVARAFGRQQTVAATYSFLSGNAHFVGVSYVGEFANDLAVHLSTGLLEDGGENYLVSGQIEKRVGGIWVHGGYHRFLSIFGTSIPGGVPIGKDLLLPPGTSRTNTYQVFSAGVAGKLGRRIGLELSAAATKNDSGTADGDVDNVSGRFKLDYAMTERLKIYTDLQAYSQTFDVQVGSSIDRRRYMAGIQIDISSRPNNLSTIPRRTEPTQR